MYRILISIVNFIKIRLLVMLVNFGQNQNRPNEICHGNKRNKPISWDFSKVTTLIGRVVEKISNDVLSHKQLSGHAEITNNRWIYVKTPKWKKTTKERKFTIIKRNYSRVCCDYKCSRATLFFSLFLVREKRDIYIFGRWYSGWKYPW